MQGKMVSAADLNRSAVLPKGKDAQNASCLDLLKQLVSLLQVLQGSPLLATLLEQLLTSPEAAAPVESLLSQILHPTPGEAVRPC